MKDITVGQLVNFLITFAAVLSAGALICKTAMKIGKNILSESLKPFDKRITDLRDEHQAQFQALSLQTDKNYLVSFLADVESGAKIDDTALEHFYFTYDDYQKHNCNSYIDHKVEKLKKEGKL